jgi:NAD(P)-dependent dehydrogenase (short-subunit alcohol dehydrogenase family)
MQLPHHTFLVTGAGSGLGAASADAFASAGANITAVDMSEESLATLVNSHGGRVIPCVADVTEAKQVEAAVRRAVEHFGALHGVVHCAGILHVSRILTRQGPHDLDVFRRVVEVNLIGTFNVIRLAAGTMSENQANDEGERGVIVTTSSIAFEEGQIGQIAYSASKAGVAGMTLPAARELGKFGIRVVSIAPGVFGTAMMQGTPDTVRESLEAQAAFPPRFGRPEEYASLARQIVENPMLNGTVIRLDGAMRMSAK